MTKTEFLSKRKSVGTLCHAPHTNLYLGHNGAATVCCANRYYEVGRYPEQTLEEIWNGEKYKSIRKEVDSFSFKKGCFACEYFLNLEKFKLLKISQYDVEGDYRNLKYPYKLDLELDNKCNLECIMCSGTFSSSIRKNREKKPAYSSPYNTENFISEITPFILNAKQINFFGGEPFLISIYDKIFDILLKNKSTAELYIQTNGTVFSNKTEQILNKLNINLSVSIDGGTKQVYEKIRKNASFVTVSENCKKFNTVLTKRKKNFYISSVICTTNAMDLINLIIFANKHNAKIYFHHVNNPSELSIETLGAKELKDITSFYENNISIINKFLPKNENYNSLMDVIDFFKKTHKRRIETQDMSILDKLRVVSPEKYNFLLELSKLHNLSIDVFNNELIKRKDNIYFTEKLLDNIIKSDLSDFKHMVNSYMNFNGKV